MERVPSFVAGTKDYGAESKSCAPKCAEGLDGGPQQAHVAEGGKIAIVESLSDYQSRRTVDSRLWMTHLLMVEERFWQVIVYGSDSIDDILAIFRSCDRLHV